MLKAKNSLFSDHEPPSFCLSSSLNKHSPREYQQLNDISQSNSDIQHIPGAKSEVADSLSRITSSDNFQKIKILLLSQLNKEDTYL